jgi:hypothetical protein
MNYPALILIVLGLGLASRNWHARQTGKVWNPTGDLGGPLMAAKQPEMFVMILIARWLLAAIFIGLGVLGLF